MRDARARRLAACLAALSLSGCHAAQRALRLTALEPRPALNSPESELMDRLLDEVGYDAKGPGRGELPLFEARLHQRVDQMLRIPGRWLAHMRRAELAMASGSMPDAESIGRTPTESQATRRRRLVALMGSGDRDTRAGALFVLEPADLPFVATQLGELCADPDPGVRAEAARAAVRLSARDLVPELAGALSRETDPLAQLTQLEAVADLDRPAAGEVARRLASESSSALVRALACEVIASDPGADGAARLADRLEQDDSALVRDAAARLLAVLTGLDVPVPSERDDPIDPALIDALRAWRPEALR